MKIHREEILRISGNGGEVKFKGETIAEIKKWDISIYRKFIEVRNFENKYPTIVPGIKSWEGLAYIKWNKHILLPDKVQLKLSDSRRNISYKEVEAIIDSGVDETKVTIKGTGEFPIDPAIFKPL